MRKFLFYSLVGLCVCTGALSSCQKREGELSAVPEKQDDVLMKVPLHIGQVPMKEKNASPSSRSTMPMGPEQENPMRTLAVIQFDSEGNMLEINTDNMTNHPHYHFFDLTSPDNPSGVINTNLEGVSLLSSVGRKTRVCLVANETEAGIDSLLWNKKENRRLLWNEFRIRTIEISYKLPQKGNSLDSLGHVKDIYMYGHYEGELTQDATDSPEVGSGRPLSISLARIIARVEMNIKLDKGVKIPENHSVFFGMYNVEKSAYLVPEVAEYLPASPIHSHITFDPVNRTDLLSETAATFYFYMAPHVVQDHRDNVTYFAIWCVPNDVTGEELQRDKTNAEKNGTRPKYPYAKVLMCNDPLTEGDTPSAEGAYWLNRNSIYHVNLTLTYTDENAASRSMPDGKYVINLKRLTLPDISPKTP